MDLELIKDKIVKNVYHIDTKTEVPLHEHDDSDEVFYCIAGSGFGVLEDRETKLTIGETFTVPAGVKHALRTDEDLYVASFIIPVVQK